MFELYCTRTGFARSKNVSGADVLPWQGYFVGQSFILALFVYLRNLSSPPPPPSPLRSLSLLTCSPLHSQFRHSLDCLVGGSSRSLAPDSLDSFPQPVFRFVPSSRKALALPRIEVSSSRCPPAAHTAAALLQLREQSPSWIQFASNSHLKASSLFKHLAPSRCLWMCYAWATGKTRIVDACCRGESSPAPGALKGRMRFWEDSVKLSVSQKREGVAIHDRLRFCPGRA